MLARPDREATAMNTTRFSNLCSRLRALGPYVALELLLPGGTLIALLLWLSQRFDVAGFGPVHAYVAARRLANPAVATEPYELDADPCPPWEGNEPLCAACR
jgi:hypothetical protein